MRRLGGFYLLAVAVFLLPVVFPDNYYVTVVGVAIGLNVILAVGLNLLMGYCGQISLGHAAFFGIGAYSSAILTVRFDWDPWLAMAAGLAAVFVIANLIARPILRLRGHYLAMATLGFGIIVHIVMVQTGDWTGGPDGMWGIPTLSILGWEVNSDLRWYIVVSTVALGVIWVSLNLIASRPGRALRAVHGSEFAARMMGVDTSKTKVNVFVFAALCGSLAGSLFAHQQAFVSPESFNFFFSIELVTMVVLGGMASTFGAAFGAGLLTLLPEFLVVFEEYEVIIFGAILMGVMIFMPQGLFVGLAQALRAVVGRFRIAAPPAPESR